MLTLGLMSGTSLDGMDAVLVRWPDGGAQALELLGHQHSPFAPALRAELLALNRAGDNELHRAQLAGNALAQLGARLCAQLLQEARLSPQAVAAIGAHGQTVRHRPGEFDGLGYSVQLLNGALLAELSGIAVVCDLRSRDVAAGGQGAPLVPAFHAAMLADAQRAVAVLNLGGIANLTLLPPDGPVSGYDCGPGNMLMDLWCQRHLGLAYDADGAWAASGQVHDALLQALLSEPFLHRAPPKSTGRDVFHADWLQAHLASLADTHPGRAPSAADVQRSLLELTARSATDALRRSLPDVRTLWVCGGGCFNRLLMQRLAALLPDVAVQPSDGAGLPAQQVEAAAFAWLARMHLLQQPGNLPKVTGAAGLRLLGCCYPA